MRFKVREHKTNRKGIIMGLSSAEGLGLAGKVLIKAGQALADDQKITKGEWIEILKTAAADAWDEYSDNDDAPNVE